MDFAQILSSQYTHQEMKILKILLPSRGHFNLDIESLQFMAF